MGPQSNGARRGSIYPFYVVDKDEKEEDKPESGLYGIQKKQDDFAAELRKLG